MYREKRLRRRQTTRERERERSIHIHMYIHIHMHTHVHICVCMYIYIRGRGERDRERQITEKQTATRETNTKKNYGTDVAGFQTSGGLGSQKLAKGRHLGLWSAASPGSPNPFTKETTLNDIGIQEWFWVHSFIQGHSALWQNSNQLAQKA